MSSLDKKRLAAFAALATLVALAFLPCLHGPFLWDDDRYPANPWLALPGALARLWRPGGTVQYYPLTFTSFWLERQIWGLWPTGFHAVNLALHAANAALAAVCLRRLGWRGAWFAAALFAVHPVHAESVAWLSERKNLLSAFFYLWAFYGFLRFEDEAGGRWYAFSLVSFVLALLAKTTACTLPAALLLARWARKRPLDDRFLAALVPFFAAAAAAGVATAAIERASVGASGAEFSLSLLQKALLACREPFFYLGKLVWPTKLSFSYDRWLVDPRSASWWAWPAMLCAAAAAVCAVGRRLGRAVPAAAGYFLVTLAPAMSFVSVYTFRFSFVADHYQYLASLGPLALAAEALWPARRRWAAAVLVLALVPLARARAALYADPEALWRDAVEHSPASPLARVNYGFCLRGRGLPEESAAQFREAIRLKPDFEDAYENLGLALQQLGREDEARAQFERALRVQPDLVSAHESLGNLLLRRGRYAAALPHFADVVRLRPGEPSAYNNLGVALGGLGRASEAAECFRRALELRPDYAAARDNLRLALGAAGVRR